MAHRRCSFLTVIEQSSAHWRSRSVEPVDSMLVEQFRAGQSDAVTLLWNVFGVKFTRRLRKKYRRLLEPDRCEHIALDAVERAWEHRTEFDPAKGRLEAWVWRITCRRAAEELRKPWFKERCQETSLSPEKLVLLAQPHSVCADQGLRECERGLGAPDLVRRAMAVLSDVELKIVSADMNSPEGVTSSLEMSQQLTLAPSTIRWHRARALAKLKAELDRLGYPSRGSAGRLAELD